MSEKIVFTSRIKNLNIVKRKGATIVTATPGGTKSEMTPTSWIEFRDHKRVTGDPEEIEIIRQYIKDHSSGGIAEVVPETPGDVLREKEAGLAEAMKQLEEAKKLAGKAAEGTPEPRTDTVEEKKALEFTEECPDCGWVAKSSVSQSQARNKLRGHRAGKHRK